MCGLAPFQLMLVFAVGKSQREKVRECQLVLSGSGEDSSQHHDAGLLEARLSGSSSKLCSQISSRGKLGSGCFCLLLLC